MASHRRGQGALEFLMTYGWALLVILVGLVVLWQWGLFNIGQRVEPGSFGFWGLMIHDGNDFVLDSAGRLQVSVVNTAGANITVGEYNATIDAQTSSADCDCVITPGEIRVLELTHPAWAGPSGGRFEAHMVMLYTDNRTGGTVYQSSGRIWGNVELPSP